MTGKQTTSYIVLYVSQSLNPLIIRNKPVTNLSFPSCRKEGGHEWFRPACSLPHPRGWEGGQHPVPSPSGPVSHRCPWNCTQRSGIYGTNTPAVTLL